MDQKNEKMTLNEFINKNLKNKIKNLMFYIEEVENFYENEPLFKLFIEDNSDIHLKTYSEESEIELKNEPKKIEIRIDKNVELVSLSHIATFIGDLKLFHKDELNVNYIINPLMPQYKSFLYDKFAKNLLEHAQTINIYDIIKDIKEDKLENLKHNQQKELFMNLCTYGNEAPIKKFIDFTLSEDIEPIISNNKLKKHEILLGIQYAVMKNNLNIVKAVLNHEKINKIIDFSDKTDDLSFIWLYALKEGREEIMSYLMNDKKYQLSKEEINNLRTEHPDVIRFFNTYGINNTNINKPKI